MEKQKFDVPNLMGQEGKSYNNLEGTGVKPLRVISGILFALGVILFLFGIILIANDSYNYCFVCIFIAISCFVTSPIYSVLATIGEAAKIYKDKNIK